MKRGKFIVLNPRILLFLLCSLGVAGCLFAWNLKIDDSYITYRFGQRLAEYGNLNWNFGSAVEGYTSFLSVLISALFIKLGFDPLLGFKILSLVLVVATACLFYQAAHIYTRGRSSLAALIFPALFLFNPLTWLHAMSGMETILFTFVLVLQCYLYFYLSFSRFDNRILALLCFVSFLSGLARPEGGLWSLFVITGLLASQPQKRVPVLVFALALFIIPGILYFLWRWNYFQLFLPNTFYVKGNGLLTGSFPSDWILKDLPKFLVGFLFLYGFLSIYVQDEKSLIFKSLFRTRTEFLVLGGVLCVAYYSTTTMLMGYGIRFVYPFYQVLLVTFAIPIFAGVVIQRQSQDSVEGKSSVERLITWKLSVALGLSFLLYFGFMARLGVETWPILRGNNVSLDGYKRMGLALESVSNQCGSSHLTLYHHNMGELMYYAKSWNSLDAVGLLDTHISRFGLTADYIFEVEPDLLILPSKSRQMITRYRGEIYDDISRFLVVDFRIRDYDYVGFSAFDEFDAGTVYFFVRKSTSERCDPISDDLRASLNLSSSGYLIER